MAGLPGGPPDNALLEVLVTDGLLTGSALPAPFTVNPAVPQTSVVLETEKERHCLVENPVLRPGGTVVLHGAAQDAEDGPLNDDAMSWTLTGPTEAVGTGKEFAAPSLRPGAYSARLCALDRDAMMGETTIPFTVDRLRIADLSTAPVVDGVFEEIPEEEDPQVRRHPTISFPNGEFANVSLARNGSFLYVTVMGIPFDPSLRDGVSIAEDPCAGGEVTPQPLARRFTAYADGGLVSERGNGTGWTKDATPLGFTARASSEGGRWTCEYRIAISEAGGWNGQEICMEVACNGRHWFGETPAIANNPSKWALVRMEADVDPNFDGDKDGLPDQWEIDNLGGTSGDGTGDLDGDGRDDRSEFEAGTDPASPASHFDITQRTLTSTGIEVRWNSLADRCYDVEISTDLEEFDAVISNLVGTGGEMSYEVLLPEGLPPEDRLFVRLGVRRSR